MFENLHDPDAPTPGLQEFARVATRAKEIRRRRARTVMWTTMLSIATAVGIVAWAAVGTPAKNVVPAGDDTVSPFVEYTFAEAADISELTPIDLAGQAVEIPVGNDQLVKVDSIDGAVCLQLQDSLPDCARPSAGFHFLTSADTTVIVVDPDVNVAFVAVGAECSTAPLMGQSAQVWRCTDLDTARAKIRVIDPTQIVVAVPASGV
jgi:hypothetical protein